MFCFQIAYAVIDFMKRVVIIITWIFTLAISYAQTYTPLQADSVFKANNWKETIQAYTWLIDNGKAPRPGIAWYRIAMANYSLHDFTKAIPAFKRSIGFSNNPSAMYNLACAFNRAGLKDSCYTWLQTVFDKGYTAYDDILKDDDLASLRNEERYKTFLQKLKPLFIPAPFHQNTAS